MEEYQPELVAVVLDAPGKTFRHEAYADYKAKRPPMPDELAAQIEPLYELVVAMGLARLIIEGVEAYDVIATLARLARGVGKRVLMCLGGKAPTRLFAD